MPTLLSLAEVKQHVEKANACLGIEMDRMGWYIAYGNGPMENPWCAPYVEIDSQGYHYISIDERGNLQEHLITLDFQELLYRILKTLVSAVSSDYAAKNPERLNWEQRRLRWKKELELFGKISPEFQSRCKKEIDEVLVRVPLEDDLPNNMDYEEWEWDIVPERTAEQ